MYSLPTKSNIRLLLLTDCKANRLACKQALSQPHDCVFVIFEAETGYQGLKMARTRRPDCILLDHHLPDMEGTEFLSELAEYSNDQTLPVVMLTASDIPNNTLAQREATSILNTSDNSVSIGLSAEIFRVMREQQAIQDRSKALDQLRESEAKYRHLVQQLPVITYIASLETPGKLLYVSPQISQLGYANEDWLNDPKGLLSRVHADDLAITIEAYAHTYEYQAHLRCEYRLVDNNGKARWFLDEANVVRDEDGESLFLQGVLVDITQDKETEQELFYYRRRLEELVYQRTEQLETQCTILKSANANLDKTLIELKRTNAELRRSEMRFQLLLESVGEGIVGLDADGSCNFVNQSALTLLGYSRDEVLHQDLQSMVRHVDAIEETQPWLKNLHSECSSQSNIEIFSRKDGSCFLVECSAYPIGLDGHIDSSVLLFRDVTEYQAQIQNLAYQASHDSLTGLVNRTEFELRLARVLAGNYSGVNEHALCFLDLDHFKNINDSCGHAAGDHVLCTFGALVSSKLRQRDTLARFGGDEFALLLEHTTLDQAYSIANELCECVRNMRYIWADQAFSVSVSIGITGLVPNSGDIAGALYNADTACYEAKKKGRNQIHILPCQTPKLSSCLH